MTSVPKNIRDSASQLFYQDKETLQYKALLAITILPHPGRAILGCFIEDAVDPEEAAGYLLRVTASEDDSSEPSADGIWRFLSEWKTLVEKFRPVEAYSLSVEAKDVVFKRDGASCCVTQTQFGSVSDENARFAHIVPPSVFDDAQFSDNAPLLDMLSAFLSEELLNRLRSSALAPSGQPGRLDNVLLLSTEAFHAMTTGMISFRLRSGNRHGDATLTRTYNVVKNKFSPEQDNSKPMNARKIALENRFPEKSALANEELLSLHRRLSKTLAWLDTAKHIGLPIGPSPRPTSILPSKPRKILCRIFQRIWVTLPVFFRSRVYDTLAWVGLRLYGQFLSMTVYRLPFGLYLRRASPKLSPNHEAETHTLRMIEEFTQIPAPRAIDNLCTPRFSYLLMTRVPGRPIGPMFAAMTDEQVEQAVCDLKEYVRQLRQIPNDTTSGFQICNSVGGGILDWRIPDSQRETLRFRTESEFNKYLTDPFWDDIRKRAAVSHGTKHEIVFTHGDLNPRNILTENGRITGIVDWENAGWFPEYWEYTKAHYTVRSLIRWLADLVDQVFEGYREELWVDNMLSDLLGPF